MWVSIFWDMLHNNLCSLIKTKTRKRTELFISRLVDQRLWNDLAGSVSPSLSEDSPSTGVCDAPSNLSTLCEPSMSFPFPARYNHDIFLFYRITQKKNITKNDPGSVKPCGTDAAARGRHFQRGHRGSHQDTHGVTRSLGFGSFYAKTVTPFQRHPVLRRFLASRRL